MQSQMNVVKRLPLQEIIPLKTPLVIYVDLSSACNFKCCFCFQNENNGGIKKDILSLELAKKMVDYMAEFPDKLKMIRICGFGEPLINPHIIDIVKYMHEKNCAERIVLVTNGSLLKPELSKELVKYLDHIIISVEGIDEEQYLKFANVKINYSNFYNEIKNLCEYSKYEKCTICAKIHSEAVKKKSDLDKFFAMYADICDEITIENLINLFPEMKLNNIDTTQFRFSDLETLEKKVCPQIFKGFQINADGKVMTCCVNYKKFFNILGDIHKENLVEIWNGQTLRNLQIKHLNLQKSKIEPCKYCTFNDTSEVDFLDNHIDEIKKRMGI